MTLESPTNFSERQQRIATYFLVLSTVFWGCSFTWAKYVGDVANVRLGIGLNHSAGPILTLGYRFTIAAILWFIVFPQARKGWSKVSVYRGLFIGVLMSAAMVLQMLGLNLTSESVSAFLTALTILFVPLIAMLRVFRSPSPALWVGVVLATLGIWLLTGATPQGFGLGEVLGIGCAIAFTFYIFAVNTLVPRDNPFRITGMSMLLTGILCFAVAAILISHNGMMDWGIMIAPDVRWRMVLLILLPTVAAFGILTYFQPQIDPTRAALIYLCEPIFAVIYAYLERGRTLSFVQFGGATLIIAANVIVEMLEHWKKTRKE